MTRLRHILLVLAVCIAPAAAAEETATVLVGDSPVLVVRTMLAGRTAAERADLAQRVLAETLVDPQCDPAGFVVTEQEPGLLHIGLCGRTVIGVANADADAEGLEPVVLADRWTGQLREAWTTEKTELLSRKLIERAILGVLYPLLFLSLAVLLRLLIKRIQGWVEGLGRKRGLRIGPVLLTAGEGERGLFSRAVGVAGWACYLLLAYVFLIAFFDRFPRTTRWAGELLALLRNLGARVGSTLSELVPRLLAALFLLVVARVTLRSIGDMFRQVRTNKLRLEPLLTPETAGPAELTARILVIGIFVFLAGLLVPGEAGIALLTAFALAGLAMALGSRPLVEDFLSGLVVLYGRPFKTGQTLRIGETEGVVDHKGFLHLRLIQNDGQVVLVPNRRTALEDLRIVDAARALRAEVVLRPICEECVPDGVFRHAAAEAGLRRDDGRIELREVRAGALVYRIVWPLTAQAREAEVRDAFFRSLFERGHGLGVEILSARESTELS